MKSILLIAACIVAMGFAVASCRFAPSPKLGDTVASSVFEPADTGLINKKTRAKVADTTIVADSVGLYYIGSGSTKQFLQLVSYPSRRDTTVYWQNSTYKSERIRRDKQRSKSEVLLAQRKGFACERSGAGEILLNAQLLWLMFVMLLLQNEERSCHLTVERIQNTHN